MASINNYIPPPKPPIEDSVVKDALDPSKPYDLNCCFLLPRELRSERLKLTPFIPAIHAKPYFETSMVHPEVYRYLPWGPFRSVTELVSQIEERNRRPTDVALFIIIDTSSSQQGTNSENLGGAVAGIIGILNSSVENACTEIGYVMIMPEFQRTHVTTHAVGLLLQWCFETLKLRRVQWQANALNEASRRAAERLGFKLEGIIRWQRVLAEGKEGVEVEGGRPGRHTAMLSVCWDDWETEVRERVEVLMARIR